MRGDCISGNEKYIYYKVFALHKTLKYLMPMYFKTFHKLGNECKTKYMF